MSPTLPKCLTLCAVQKAYQAEFMKRIQAAMAAKAAARGESLDEKDKADILNLKAEVKAEAGEHSACPS